MIYNLDGSCHTRQTTKISEINRRERKKIVLAILGGIIIAPIFYTIIFMAFAII